MLTLNSRFYLYADDTQLFYSSEPSKARPIFSASGVSLFYVPILFY